MILPELKNRVIETDPYRSVVIYEGCLIFAECNGSQKQEVADEIVKRCNAYPKLLRIIADARSELYQLSDDFDPDLNALIADMRGYVAQLAGDEVDVPKELLS